MTSTFFNRRMLMGRLAAGLSAVGVGSLLAGSAEAKNRESGVRKLNRDGKPADGTQMITALITHDGLLYIAGQGANSNGPVGKDDIPMAGRREPRSRWPHFRAIPRWKSIASPL